MNRSAAKNDFRKSLFAGGWSFCFPLTCNRPRCCLARRCLPRVPVKSSHSSWFLLVCNAPLLTRESRVFSEYENARPCQPVRSSASKRPPVEAARPSRGLVRGQCRAHQRCRRPKQSATRPSRPAGPSRSSFCSAPRRPGVARAKADLPQSSSDFGFSPIQTNPSRSV